MFYKDLVKGAIEKKFKTIVEQEVRETLLEHLTKAQKSVSYLILQSCRQRRLITLRAICTD